MEAIAGSPRSLMSGVSMKMKEKMERWFNPHGFTPVTLGGCDLSTILRKQPVEVSDAAAEFFATCIQTERDSGPSDIVFHSRQDIANVNHNFPCDRIVCHGFVTFASLCDGDVVAMDVTDGAVYHISHDKYDSDGGISQGWNHGCSALLPDLPITREHIIKTAERCLGPIDEHLDQLLREDEHEEC
jgi:hypothetical protein